MKIIELDGKEMTERKAAYAYLCRVMCFPSYFGNNLDALYDELTDISVPTILHIRNWDGLLEMGVYGEKMQQTFVDAEKNDPAISLEIE